MTVAVFLNVVAGQACALMLMFWLAWAGVSWPVSTVVLPYATVNGLAASVSVDDAAVAPAVTAAAPRAVATSVRFIPTSKFRVWAFFLPQMTPQNARICGVL